MSQWKQIMEIKQGYTKVADHIRNELKFYISIAIGVVALITYANTNFVTTARGEEMMDKTQAAIKDAADERNRRDDALSNELKMLAVQVNESNGLILLHMDKEKLSDVKSDIRRNEQETFSIEQFVSVNGANEQAKARLRALKAEHVDLEDTKDCIINNNKLCD